MAQTSGYNGDTDFLKWYKSLYGTDYDEKVGLVRREGMSDGDWDVGSILHNYYIKNQQNEAARQENINDINARYDGMADTAKAGFDSARRTLGENKATAQQNASIVYDKLRKYLPMKQRAQGLGGLGTQSAELAAQNTYMTQMGGIASDYQSGMRAIDENETSSLGELERYRSDSLRENDTLHDSLARSYGETADTDARNAMDRYLQGEETRRGETFDLVHGALTSSTSSDVNELLNYVAGYEGKVSDEQYGVLRAYAETVANANAKKASDEATGRQESEFNSNYDMAVSVLSSSTSTDASELMAYVNGLEGKVSPEQLAALRQMATNIATTNTTNKNAADQANAWQVANDVATQLLDSGSYELAREYIEKNRGILGDETADAYLGVIEASMASDEQEKTEEEQAAKDERITSGQENISYNGMQFRIVKPYTGNVNEKLGKANLEQLDKAGYNGPYDPKIPNGTTFAINLGWSDGYITYYNGAWYESKSAGKSTAVPTPTPTPTPTPQPESNPPLSIGTPEGESVSDVIINSYGVAQDPAAQAGQVIGGWLANYLKGLFQKK